MLIDIIAGARPNFVKIAPIIRALEQRKTQGSALRYRLVHTGQHYDARMSGDFFIQLGIPAPDVNLQVGSGTQAEQTGTIMVRYEKLLLETPCDICLVVGDVNSTMACAIAAKKLGVKVAHVEAGIRSGDITMPEEINRIVTDSLSDWYFTTTERANDLLVQTGATSDQIYFVGNPMIDTLIHHQQDLRAPEFFESQGLEAGAYFLLTLHRPTNVDRPVHFSNLLIEIGNATREYPVLFPVHPRTVNNLKINTPVPKNFHLVEPQAYLEFIWLAKHALAVITDSGGVTEETAVLGVPCLTMRETNECPETVEIGTNVLVGCEPGALTSALEPLFRGRWKSGAIPPLWDGNAGSRIVDTLDSIARRSHFY